MDKIKFMTRSCDLYRFWEIPEGHMLFISSENHSDAVIMLAKSQEDALAADYYRFVNDVIEYELIEGTEN